MDRKVASKWSLGSFRLRGSPMPRRQQRAFEQWVWLERVRCEVARRASDIQTREAPIVEVLPGPGTPERSMGSPFILTEILRLMTSRGDGLSMAARQAQALALQAMEVGDALAAQVLATRALAIDRSCTDAASVLALLTAASPQERVRRLEEVVSTAEVMLGCRVLQEFEGRLWCHGPARPYLRAKLQLARSLVEAGRRADAVAGYEDLLRLNVPDEQGAREFLIAAYLVRDDLEGAGRLLRSYVDCAGVFDWALVLQEFLSGDRAQAGRLRDHLVWKNLHVAPLLCGRRRVPSRLPQQGAPAPIAEAVRCALILGEAWRSHRAARQWLRSA